jgi:PAS domain S-box-containing protein
MRPRIFAIHRRTAGAVYAKLQPSRVLGLLLFGIVLGLWSLFAWLRVIEHDEVLASRGRQLTAFANSYARYAVALAEVGTGNHHSFRALDRELDRADLTGFIVAQDLPLGAHLRLRRLGDGFLLAGDGSTDQEASAAGSAGVSEMLTAQSEHAEAGIFVEADWSKKDVLAELREEQNYELSGLLAVTLIVAGLGVSLTRQLTRREAAHAALRESKVRLATAQRIARIGTWERELGSHQVSWSEEFHGIFRFSPDQSDVMGARLEDVAIEEDKTLVERWAGRLDPAARQPGIEFRLRRGDGGIATVFCDAAAILDEADRPVKFIGTVQDITEAKRLEENRTELERQLLHAQKLDALGTLAGGVAHDLNNTLVPVIALSKLVRNKLPEKSRERANLEMIMLAGERARQLVGQILAFSRKDKPNKQVFCVGTVVADAVKLLRASVPATIRIDEATSEVPLMAGDPGQMHQVIINLVVNAVQAIGDAMGTVMVGLRPESGELLDQDPHQPSGPMIRLSVRDSGRGMDETTRRRVFEPFFTTKEVGQGTGLGLSIVHGIVAEHGGRITVESQVGKGTCFNVLLPALSAEQATDLRRAEQTVAA